MGILVGKGGVYGNVLRIQPPLIITEEECNRLLEALEKVLKEV
jgi:4-aminobutyrate aminotransferase-like enzyme